MIALANVINANALRFLIFPSCNREPKRAQRSQRKISEPFVFYAFFAVRFLLVRNLLPHLEQDPSRWLRVTHKVSQFRDLGQRTRLCFRPKLASIAARRI